VEKGEPLFVIQTDKAAIEVEAQESGILMGLNADPEEVIPVTQVIGYLAQPGESLPTQPVSAQPVLDSNETSESIYAEDDDLAAEAKSMEGHKELVRATPVARNLAREMDLDLHDVPGSGPRGRIYRADVERYIHSQVSLEPKITGSAQANDRTEQKTLPLTLPQARERQRVPMKGSRAIIAKRMSYSAQTIPHIHVSLTVDMSEVGRLRERVNPVYEQQIGRGISYTAILALAVVHLLPNYPLLNSSLVGEEIILWEDVHLGVATELEDSLVVPVVREAQTLKLGQIAQEISDLVLRARSRKLQPAEMSGSTFTITNLGMLGAANFTAIINPPEAAILAVGQILNTPWVVGDEVTIRPIMNLTLAVDHRITDGAQATRFLSNLKQILENPYLLM